MGNEMGNNNVSGLQEDEKARTEEDQGKFLQDDNHADELKGENRTKLEAEEKDFHEKWKLHENGEATDFHEVLVPSETLLADLAVEETPEENETSDGNEEPDAEFKPSSERVETLPKSNDADLKSEDQEFASSDGPGFWEKTEGNLLTTVEHGSEEEMLIGREYIEAKNQAVDSKTGSSERDPNSAEQEVVQAEQVAEGISTPQSENGDSVSNQVVENMYLCVKPETGDQTVATGMIAVKAKADEDEVKMILCEDEFDVFSPEEVHTCSENEHNVNQSPLDVLQLPQEAPDSAVEASYELGATNSPLAEPEAPKIALNSPLETLESSPEASESPLEASHPQPLALALLVKASDSPLEELKAPEDALNPTMETLEPPLEALKSPLETSDQQPLALELIVKASDPSLEASNSQLEATEPSIETSESPSEDSDSPVEASKSILETQLKASELPLEALDSPLEVSESQLEAFPQASSINSSQEVCEPHDKTINAKEAIPTQPQVLEFIVKASDPSLEALNSQLGASEPSIETSDSPSEDSDPPVEASKSRVETQLEASESQLEAFPQASLINSSQEVYEPHDNTINVKEAESSEEKDQNFETSESMTSQSEEICAGSNSNRSGRDNALASSVEKNCVVSESDVHNDKPQVVFLNQTLKPCIEEQPVMEESTLLNEESKPIGSEVESEENKGEYIKTEFCDQELKGLKIDDFIASQLEFLASETDPKKSSEQSAHEFDSTNGIAENCQIKDLEAKCNEEQVAFADKSLKLDSYDVADMMSEIEAVSTESNVTEYTHGEDRPGEEIGDKEKESLLENDRDGGNIIDNSMSLMSGNHSQDLPPYCPDSEAFKDKNELISDSKSECFITTERFHASPSVAIVQSMMPTPEKEALEDIQETSVMAEMSSLLFSEQSVKGEETVEKLMTEPSSDNASNHVEFRKSPSFHFDLSTETKCEESDQTPLLCHDKTAGTSLISRDEAMFQKDNVQGDYNAAEDEDVLVEEKTIRMERSDSERPSAPFLSFLVTAEKQEKNGADKKSRKDPWRVIHKTFALTSPRDTNGKRKAKSSIFSTCICCSTKTP
ncbi:hypothetical protein POM88_014331 [Heracleum sosnowskyi]|uniref:Uncharacterized protein n=1 Tax=Heracleum sosnowskyi TaxID=360622 RepID=A0AAD8J3V8_9APIA|nr:hypothetical protein POM88_014331 [Heracleum sosnowskyi]